MVQLFLGDLVPQDPATINSWCIVSNRGYIVGEYANYSTSINYLFPQLGFEVELMQRVSLSLIAHNSVSKLLAQPIALMKPSTHWPWRFLMRPPPPARPGQPGKEPSVFSLC